jgi:pimeloyl-ACP methyl ester carboxylesterase
MRTTLLALALVLGSTTTAAAAPGRYATVGGLKMYYEIHGQGAPLVLLHGGLCTIDSCFGKVIPLLARTRKVIAIEQQAHGHTNDVDRPLDFDQMARDTVALLRQIGVEKADFLGYSVGGAVGLRIAIHQPALVRRLIVLAAGHSNDGWDPAVLAGMARLTPEVIPAVFRDAYAKTAPDPKHWPVLVEKIKQLALTAKPLPTDQVRAIRVPVLLMQGDRDIIRPEYAVQLYHLLPQAQLAVLPGSDHFAVVVHPDWVASLGLGFLDAPAAPAVTALK